MFTAAILERTLRDEAARMRSDGDGQGPDEHVKSLRSKRMSAGRLLSDLEALGLPDGLSRQIRDVLDRRNRLVHDLTDDPEMLNAISGNCEDLPGLLNRIEWIAFDCADMTAHVAARMLAASKLRLD